MFDSSQLNSSEVVTETSYPLSSMQQGMLFHRLRSQQTGVDIEQLLCTLHEKLDVSAFKQSWQRVIERHPVLRTSFHWQGLDSPVQRVHQQVQLPFVQQDWRGLANQEQAEHLNAYLQRDRQQGFELDQPPLLRFAIFQIAEAHYQFVWTFHHILLDGRSFPLILNEVFAFYEAICRGQDLQPVQPPSYKHYIEWLQQQNWSEAKEFWQQLLQGFQTPTPLPFAQSSLSSAPTGHAEEQVHLPTVTTAALQSLAQQHGLTPNTLVQGAWALLLNYYSGTGDVVFGATRACRRSAINQAELMVGLFINTLPVRVQITPETPLLPWLKELRHQHLAVRAYEHTPLVEVQQWSEVPPGQPLFNSLVVFENYNLNTALQNQGASWKKREFQLFEQPSYPLMLGAQLGTELALKISYDRHQFERSTITRMLGHLTALLEGMVANPNQQLGDLPVLTPAERHQILVEWNATEVEYPQHLRLHDLVEAQVERSPDAVAVTFDGKRLTYRELNSRANQLAHHLQTLRVKPEVTVGICIERSLEMIIALLAILKAGGAYVPLDPTYPQERLAHILSDSQLAVVLTQEKLLSLLPQQGIPAICLDTHWEKIASESEANPTSTATAENLAYIIYTSGSTGKPKGVLIEHQGAVNTILDINQRFQVGSSDRVLAVCSLNFDLSVYDVFGMLAAGGTIVLPKPAIAPDLSHWSDLMHREQVTLWNSAPPVMQMFAGHLVDHCCPLPASLRLVMLSGDWIPLTLPDLIRQLKTGTDQVEIVSLGGATEASIWSILYPIGAISPTWKSIPYGKPMANQQFYILDERLHPVPAGMVGELYIGGDGVARGYHNRPDLNATKFIPSPFSDHPRSRLYRTGDLGRYMPDGTIEFLGRIDHQVKIRGFRVEMGEIEAILVQHPAIRETAILAREDASGNNQLVAYLVLKQPDVQSSHLTQDDSKQLIGDMRSFLKEKLPDYMVPAAFVLLEALPLTPNGKLDRQALPAPEFINQALNSAATSSFVAPRDRIEQQLTEIWQEFLGVPAIGIHDNFFDLGGHSLIAVRLWAKVEKTFNQELPLATLFQAPTIEQLARHLRQSGTPLPCPAMAVIQSGKAGTSKPPLFCIHVHGRGMKLYRPLIRHLDPEQPIYGLSVHFVKDVVPMERTEEFAAYYVQQIRMIQPEGPYLLAGISFGGLIAYEMAQQLRSQGQQVALLGLFDTTPPTTAANTLTPVKEHETESLHQFTQPHSINLVQRFKSQLESVQYLGTWLWFKYCRLAVIFYRIAQRPMPEYLENFNYVLENVRISRIYTPQPYSGQVTLFKAKGRDDVDIEVGWSPLIKNLEVCEVPGDHMGMFCEPEVRILSEKLQSCIDRAIAPKVSRQKSERVRG
ncbi:amino acid adenylation domain-containing protein [Kovacikia minuta CCNUW1]|uniref:amino acid adenylation domain-containing protein n=1 Tax=Kovacikia minuta TaxID=2931930 RepID=UPI001CCFD2C2|nr:non-ribosomal peptide synthetase [Kovacikia minuta]UBF27777.1 amino acid adenylation domain-containing protein [Kovacikia minuta CCNUW1]